MSTIGAVADRVYRDFLAGPDDQPIRTALSGAVDDEATSWTLSTAMLGVEEVAALTPGVIVECEAEQALITAHDGEGVLTVVRGFNGTVAVDHDSESLVTIAPTYPRATVLDAVRDAVTMLYPQVWRVCTERLSLSSPYTEIDETAESVEECYLIEGTELIPVRARIRRGVSGSASGRVLAVEGGITDGEVDITYRARFARPAGEFEELLFHDVLPEWESVVVLFAAAHVMAGTVEINQATHNWLSEELAGQNYPPTTATRIASQLMSVGERRLDRLAKAWRMRNQPRRVVQVPANRWAL